MNIWKNWTCILAICTCVGAHLQANENDEDEIPFPTQQDTIRFLKGKLPLALEVLNRVKTGEGEEAHEEVMEEFQRNYHEYKEILEWDGREAANLFFARFSIELRMDKMLHEYHDIAETEEDLKALQKQIRHVLEERLEHDKLAVQMELKLLEKERGNLKEELKELEQIGEEEISDELLDLLEANDD